MCALMTLAILVVAAPNREDLTPKEAKPAHEQILGDWLYVGNGKEPNLQPPAGGPVFKFRLMPSESLWISNDQPNPGNGLSAKIVFDWTKNPVAIDFIPRHGGGPLRGIVKLDGDRLTLAWAAGDARPADFSLANNVHHFTRIKK